jgi:hypothetical protein
MKNSKLLNILKILTPEEIEGVKELLGTNLLVKGSVKAECQQLFRYVMRFYPNFEDERLDRDITLIAVFEDKSLKINKLEKTMSALLGVVEHYIVYYVEDKKFKEVENNLTLLKFYREREFISRCESLLKKTATILATKEANLNIDYYFWLSKYNTEQINIEMMKGKKISIADSDEYCFVVNQYSILFALEELHGIVFMQAKFTANTLAIFHQLDEWINANEIYRSNILIRLFQLQLWILIEVKNDGFDKYHDDFFRLFVSNSQMYDKQIRYSLATAERTLLVIRKGFNNTYENEKRTFDVYKAHLEAGYLFLNNRIHSQTALNMINTAITLKENEWAKDFIKKWSPLINSPCKKSKK